VNTTIVVFVESDSSDMEITSRFELPQLSETLSFNEKGTSYLPITRSRINYGCFTPEQMGMNTTKYCTKQRYEETILRYLTVNPSKKTFGISHDETIHQ
jgi:hypothetical protein